MKRKNRSLLKNVFILLLIGCITTLFLSSTGCCGKQVEKRNDVQLVLMVVIDQLRADSVSRLANRFGKGGFKYLIDNGIWYKNARYEHITTLTAVGHATLFTGATPADHGIVGNYWFDKKTGEVVKTVEKNGMIGPMQLIGSTISDELVLAFDRQSRVFNVSLKDRGAILPGGYLGKAFWYDKKTGGFQTGEYYYKKSPQWLTIWNNLKKVDQYKDRSWELLQEQSTYIYAQSDHRPEEKPYNETPEHKRTVVFPHSLANFEKEEFYRQLCFTPFADELTVDFACHVLKEEKLGRGAFTDMLTVSLSVTDYVGHTWGPASLEYEDNLLHVDAALAKLFGFIDKTIGLNKTLIVVTGDHGGDLNPDYRQRLGMAAGRIDPADFTRVVNAALQEKYGVQDNFVIGFRNPSIFLDLQVVEQLKLDIKEVERIAVEAVMEVEGIAFAVSRSDMLAGRFPDLPLLREMKLVFHPERSGNILVVQKPFWFLYHVHDEDAAMHGAPYSYDNHVPLFFVGPGINKQEVFRLVRPRDIAATIALKLGIQAPSGSSGIPLIEVLQ